MIFLGTSDLIKIFSILKVWSSGMGKDSREDR